MDFGAVLLQIPASAGAAAQAAQPALDLTQHGMTAGVIVKTLTDMVKGVWGGGPDVKTPGWVAPITATILGPLATAAVVVGNRISIGDPSTLVMVAVVGLTVATGSAVGMTLGHDKVRPTPPPPLTPLPPRPPSALPSHVLCEHCGKMVQLDASTPPITLAQNPQAPFPLAPPRASDPASAVKG